MDDTGPLTLLMNFIGPILLGIAIALALYATWRRRRNPGAQARTDHALAIYMRLKKPSGSALKVEID
jgi:hypothetical protein